MAHKKTNAPDGDRGARKTLDNSKGPIDSPEVWHPSTLGLLLIVNRLLRLLVERGLLDEDELRQVLVSEWIRVPQEFPAARATLELPIRLLLALGADPTSSEAVQ